MQDYGTVKYEDKELVITQQPFLDTIFDQFCKLHGYCSNITDSDGCEYKVFWPIINPESETEDDMCDWDNYTVTLTWKPEGL